MAVSVYNFSESLFHTIWNVNSNLILIVSASKSHSQAWVQVALVLASTQVGLSLSHKSDRNQNTEMSGIQSKTGIVLLLMHFRFMRLSVLV